MKNYLCVLILGMFVLPAFSQDEPPPTTGDTGEVSNIADLIKKAEEGDSFIQLALAVMYEEGEGVPQDYKEAAKWYLVLAEQGIALAQSNLGSLYYNGQGVSQDYKEAAKWFREAANQGTAAAQHSLGVMYSNGQGVPQDYKEAVRWWKLAAEQNHASAQNNLGTMYDYGRGVPQDYVQAHMWYNLAAASGGDDEDREMAAKNRDLTAEKMTSEQIAEAQRLAREWKPKTGSQ